ncbi:uncharacterized protein [Epargyreus clarus]|uniref:uncharacterized protein n=1 Tax=Epargyreus clarus TaxID=520877 RepID=UPI003C2CB981
MIANGAPATCTERLHIQTISLPAELYLAYEAGVLQLSAAARRARALCSLRAAAAPPLRHAAALLAAAAALPPPPHAARPRLENLIKLLGNQFIVVLKKLGAYLNSQQHGSKDFVKLMPVKEAAKFRNFVCSLDANGKLNYKQYVTESLAEGIATSSAEDDAGDEEDDTREDDITEQESDRMDADSDVETICLDD